jgi:hypothetical protein
MRHLPSYLVPALVLVLPWVAACGDGDEDDEGAKMTQGDDAPADDMAADDVASDDDAADDVASDDDAADDEGPEQASDDDAPATPTPASPATAEMLDDLVTDVCERGAECGGDVMEDCLAEGAEGLALLGALCPELIVPFLECAADSPTCDPEVDCAAEILALQACGSALGGTDPSGSDPVVDEATIQMACEVYSSCEGDDADTCVQEFGVASAGLELVCPGAFGPYIECIASMTGCDPELECADEMAVLEQCGLN